MQDRQHRAVMLRAQKFIGMPCRRQRTGLGFPIADHAGRNQLRIVKNRAERVRERIAQLAALVDRARRFRCHMAGDSARERELLAQLRQSLLVLPDVRINLTVGSLQIGVGNKEIAAMSRPRKQDHVQVIFLDDAVHMHIDKILSRHRPPVADDLFFDVLSAQRLSQKRIVQQIKLRCGQIVCGTPVCVHLL